MLTSFRDSFQRKLTLAPKEHQTQDEISALRDNAARVGFVINVRWILVLVLVVYSVFGFLIHLSKNDFSTLLGYMAIPANAVILVIVYNYFFMIGKDRLANIALANVIQLALDTAVITILVYFSGGTESWFWVIYLLILFEVAVIIPRRSMLWWFACVMLLALGIIEWGNYMGWLPYIAIPLNDSESWRMLEFVSLRYLWQVAVIVGTALVAQRLLDMYRGELRESRNVAIHDGLTGLYTRVYFKRMLEVEAARALHDDRRIYIALIDIDNFATVNKYFGITTGDEILSRIAQSLQRDARKFSTGSQSPNIVARISGEEFAVLFIENAHESNGQPTAEDVSLLSRTITTSISEIEYHGITVTASAGIAGIPEDALDADLLMDRADEALGAAIAQGGNTVVMFEDCIDEDKPYLGAQEAPLETIARYLDE